MKQPLSRILALAMFLALLGCSTPQKDILGTWQEVGTERTLTFHRDGMLNIASGGTRIGGRYRFVGDEYIELEFEGLLGGLIELAEAMSGPGAMLFEVDIKRDRLMLVDARGKATYYQRVR